MRSIGLSLVMIIFSGPVFACPQLNGTFNCTNSDGTTDTLQISTSTDSSGFTNYSYLDGVYNFVAVADGQLHQLSDDQTFHGTNYTAWCDDDQTMKGFARTHLYKPADGSFVGDLSYTEYASMSGNNLSRVIAGQLYTPQGAVPQNSTAVCTPVNAVKK